MKKSFLFGILFLTLLLVKAPLIVKAQAVDELYTDRLLKRVLLNWMTKKDDGTKSSIIELTINKEGGIICVKTIKSSGDKNFDDNAVVSLYKTAPFEYLPQDADDTVSFDFLFNSKTPLVSKVDVITDQNYSDCNQQTVINGTDYSFYLYNLQKEIESFWSPSLSTQNRALITTFSVNNDGSINHLSVIRSSGDQTFDTDALNAIKSAIPFDVLPEGTNKKPVQIQFGFFYNSLRSRQQNNQYSTNCFLMDSDSILVKDYENYKSQITYVLDGHLPQNRYGIKKDILLNVLVNKKGEILEVNVTKSSGSKSFDKYIVSSLKKCSLPPIPDSMNTDIFSFGYSIKTQKNAFKTDFFESIGWLWEKKLKDQCIWE